MSASRFKPTAPDLIFAFHHLILVMVIKYISFFVLFGFFTINSLAIYLIGPYAWDDGAITLAYAKTLVESGKFALTSASEIVEGSSSISFVLLCAFAHSLFKFNFAQFILFSQLLTFIFSIITVSLVYWILLKKIANKYWCILISAMIGCTPIFTKEIMNGMEMTMLSALFLLLLIFYESRSKWIFAVIPALLLTRFEVAYYLIFSFSVCLLLEKNDRDVLLKYLAYVFLCLFIISLARYYYFNDFMPNTIYAKMNPPYTPVDWHAKIDFKYSGLTEFFDVYFWFIQFSFALVFLNKGLDLNLKLILIVAFVSFAFISGKNMGYEGRMILASLPIFVLLVVDLIPMNENISFSLNKRIELSFSREGFMVFTLTVCLALFFTSNSNLLIDNFMRQAYAGYIQQKYPGFIQAALDKRNFGDDVHTEFGGGVVKTLGPITPENYRITGVAVNELRIILGLDRIKFLVPDVGGLGLCCPNLRVIDSALLTNRFLAKNGYSEFENLLKNEKPDVIETHGIWSKVSSIYRLSYFHENYKPIVFNNNLFWINNKFIEKLAAVDRPGLSFVGYQSNLTDVRYANFDIDKAYLDSHFINLKSN